MASARSQFEHVPELDGIRAIAVFLVIASHAGLYGKVPGGFGVTVFFFLSGYLITTLLRMEFTRTGTLDFGAFYLRRTLRIMPPLYITLIILTVVSALGFLGPIVHWSAVPWDYTFLSNYSQLWGESVGLPCPLWSLAIEEHFYLLFPAVSLFLMRKRSAAQIAGLFACACVLILLLRLLTVWQFPEHIADNYVWTHTRLDSILFGSILAMYQNPMLDAEAWRPRSWHVAGACLLIILTFAIRSEVFRQTLRYTFQGAALFVLFSFVLSGGSRNLNRLLSSKPLVWIGLLSYTLYLCHLGIDAALKAQLGMSPLVAGIVGFPLALLYAQLTRWLIEVPILNWRRRHRASVKAIAVQPITVSEASLDPLPAAVPSK